MTEKTDESVPGVTLVKRSTLADLWQRFVQYDIRRGFGFAPTPNVHADLWRNGLVASSDAIILADAAGRIVGFSQGASVLFGQPADRVAGIDLLQFCAVNLRSAAGRSELSLTPGQPISNLRVEVIGPDDSRQPALFSLDYATRAGAVTGAIAVIKDNSEVEMLTLTDPLTGLYNRRHFDRKMVEDYGLLLRGQTKAISLVFLDVDHFHEFNQDHGHPAGDVALRMVGRVLYGCIRRSDTAARYGGEEFVLILPQTGRRGTGLLAERVRRVIEALDIPVAEDRTAKITVSVGMQTHSSRKFVSAENLVDQANRAMLRAKSSGRNRICAW